jgi:hypothetical protein
VAGEAGAAPASGPVPDPVQVRADRAHADVQLGSGDLRVGLAAGDQRVTSSRSAGRAAGMDHRGLPGIGGRQHYTGPVAQLVQIQPTRSVVLAQQHD